MKKFEFLLSLILRIVILIWAITNLINEGEWGFVWDGIAYFVTVIVMVFSLFANIYILYKTPIKDKENEYVW